jgi:hypothetical protein
MDYSPCIKNVNLATDLKRPAGWRLKRPGEDSVVQHGKDSSLRKLPTAAAEEKAL